MADLILHAALDRLGQSDSFAHYWAYLQKEWLRTKDDLLAATANEKAWLQLQIPLRLKVEILSLLEEEQQQEQPDPEAESSADNEWETYYNEEYGAYYYYNKATGESQWATNESPDETPEQASPDFSGVLYFSQPKQVSPIHSRRPIGESDDEESVDSAARSDDSSSDGSEHFVVTERGHRQCLKVEAYKIRHRAPPHATRLDADSFAEASAPPAPQESAVAYNSPAPEAVTSPSSPVLFLSKHPLPSMRGSSGTPVRGNAKGAPVLSPHELTQFSSPTPEQRFPVHQKPSSKAKPLFRRMNIFGKGRKGPPSPEASHPNHGGQGKPDGHSVNIQRLCEMGFSRSSAEYALELAGGSLEEASTMLAESADAEAVAVAVAIT